MAYLYLDDEVQALYGGVLTSTTLDTLFDVLRKLVMRKVDELMQRDCPDFVQGRTWADTFQAIHDTMVKNGRITVGRYFTLYLPSPVLGATP